MSHKATILVADDEASIRDALRLVLEDDYSVVEAADGREAVKMALSRPPDALLLDILMPELNGLDAVSQIRAAGVDIPILMISGHATISTAVEALRRGAQDFLEKPLEREIVLRRLAAQLERARLRDTVETQKADEGDRWRLIGQSDAMLEVREFISRVGPTQATVLITGESGTGKELVARAIHEASTRVGGPFIKVNCAAIPDDLIESELFGHEKGSFTGAQARQKGRFARAHSGTIFLDEIGDMSMKTQAKVLRALQDGEIEPLGAGRPTRVDVRVLAATNKDLRKQIANGAFREDLFYRLSVLPVHLPPLRERNGDISLLVDHLAAQVCRENNFRPREFTPAAHARLEAFSWPGNVRELRNTVERAIILSRGEQIDLTDLPDAQDPVPGAQGRLMGIESLREFKEASEKEFLRRKLEEYGWNITRTAQAIGTPRSNLYKKLEVHGLNRLASGDSS